MRYAMNIKIPRVSIARLSRDARGEESATLARAATPDTLRARSSETGEARWNATEVFPKLTVRVFAAWMQVVVNVLVTSTEYAPPLKSS